MLPHLNAAHNLARWLTGNPGDAEDVVQEAYLRAFRFFDGFHGGDGRAWLLAVVRNTCHTWMGRKPASVEFDERAHGGSGDDTVEARLVNDSRIEALRKCVEGLPEEYREMVVMRELEEMSYREISEVAAIPVGTVMSRLSRGRAKLLDCMGAKR